MWAPGSLARTRQRCQGPISAFRLLADDPIRLLREVVLLTDDRNLRVKALTRNVPVRDIPTFLRWAQEG